MGLRGRKVDKKRNAEFVVLFKDGGTLREIGEKYGISGEGVRLVLRKLGISAKDGGASTLKNKRIAEKKKKRDCVSLGRWGCDFQTYVSILNHEGKPTYSFQAQKRNARYRCIPWNITLWEWWSIWKESGQWNNRGRTIDSYCMSRIGDVGAYEKGNVFICKFSVNSSEGRSKAHRSPSNSKMLELINFAGGRKVVSEYIDVNTQYLSMLANDNYMPVSWIYNGKIFRLAEIHGLYSAEDLINEYISPKIDQGAFISRKEPSE